ncbi:hypothetical protein GM168_10250 [Clostridium perfringens]|uniref:hypothetical protein n=1 Tax=Clostridium perfringens TaxID=1502 RepID=UPI0028FEF7DE|nr:hypothetical protein [Clostridium perfringens]EHA0993956.1 hypothetical protein [Clostridium perfringens]EHA1184790.1 hypothetical protein [Clostridium perfringens]EJT6143129.1 hypothetical protein [Clostridium perfringens]MDK0899961.1 hypothetical protein [Clostridium perfringens]
MADKEVLNEKKLMFFQDFTDNVRRIFNDNIVKYNVLSWIIFNTNYSQEFQGLKARECYFSYSILEEKLNITRYKLQRIMKELINEGFIEWVSKSKSKGESSILKLNFQYGLEYGLEYGLQYGSYTENTSINGNINTVDNMVYNTDNHTLSKKHISKKQSNNIYSSKDVEEMFNYWNNKKIIKHKELKDDTKRAINKAIKNYSIDEIKQAIDIYSEILKSDYYFNYKWSLKDFLNRSNGISTFMEDGSNKANYEEWKNKDKQKEKIKGRGYANLDDL